MTANLLANSWTRQKLFTLDWSYASAVKRDLRLDLLRGYAVFVMIANHLGGASWLYLITGNNSFYVSGAEAFVFISGLVVGIVYGGIAAREGVRAAQTKAFKRALTLYKTAILLTFILIAASLVFDLPWASLLSTTNLPSLITDVLTMRQTFYLSDVMLLYTFLMAATPLAMWLLVKHQTLLVLLGSIALWLAFQFAPSQIQIPFVIAGNTTFNLAAWQLLFFGAMTLGYHKDRLELARIPRWGALGMTAFALMIIFNSFDASLTQSNPLFLKGAVGAGRLIASAALFSFAYLAATLFWKPICAALGWLLIPLGQNSLYAYTMHVFVLALARIVLPTLPVYIGTLGLANTSLQILAVLAIWGMIRRQFLFNIVPR